MKKKRQNNHKRLSRKFITSFFLPFLIGTIISILYVIFIFSVSPGFINSQEDLKKILREKEFKKTLPLILSGIYSINNMYQLYINNIAKICAFYKYNSQRLVNYKNISEKLRFINKFSFNGVNEDQIKKFHDLFFKYNNNYEYLYNQGRWFINLTKIDLEANNNDKKIINQIYSLINLIPLLKTILKITNPYYQQAEVDNQILIMFSESELFFKYPIVENYMYGSDLKSLYHTADCKTKDEQYPHYYYFKCRPYYSFLLKEVDKGHSVSISDIYKFVNGNYGMTICIQFQDVIDNEEEKKDFVSICHDMEIETIHQQLNSINNKIPGYIFLIRVGSEVPIYYPELFKKNYENLANMEFSIKNEYYNDEISLFTKNITTIIAEYKYNNSNTEIVSFDISKNNEKYNYTLFPIFFDLPEMNEPIHLLTLVYVNPHNKDFQVVYLYSTICISFVYLLMGFFLLLLSKYLITSIAKNIVRPIKIIKDLLEQNFEITTIDNNEEREIYNRNNDINNNITTNNENKNPRSDFISFSTNLNKENELGEENADNSDKGEKQKVSLVDTNNFLNDNNSVLFLSEGNNRLPNIFGDNKNINLKIKLLDDENESSDDDNDSSFDNDEEIDKTKYRSNNIQQLFMKLVDLKNAFKCLEDTKLSNDKLSDLVQAQTVFKEINNLEASSLCESNISSIFIKSEQFDKAISHLYNGIEDINRKIFPKSHNSKNKEKKINIDEIKKRIKNENLLNRYIKLFFSYYKYFKMIKKKYKNKTLYELNIDTIYITHHIELYKKCLDDYIIRVKEYVGGKDLCIGLLSKLEEKISFELSPFKEVIRENDIKNSLNKNEKEKLINEIFELFKDVDKLTHNKITTNNYNIIHLINLLKYDSDIVNAMDIPPSILIQKSNYLKGKFHFKCYDYKMAIEYFENALDYGKIGDIEITMNTYKYLIKIAKIYLDLVNNDIEFHSHEHKYKLELKEDKQRKEILENYIININNEIKSYKYIPKDIFVILNLENQSKTNDFSVNEKFSNIQKILSNIYENVTTTKDRIGILEYKNEDYRFLISLTNKDEKNEKKINEILENLELFLYSSFENINNNFTHYNNDNNNNQINRNNSSSSKKNLLNLKNKEKEKYKEEGKNPLSLFNSIKYCNGILKMKHINNLKNDKIDNWFIFVTCNMSNDDINEITQKPLNEVLFPNDETNNNLIIIFYDNVSDDSKRKLKKWIKYNNNAVLTKDELIKLKGIMGTKGERQKVIFELEKYKDKF